MNAAELGASCGPDSHLPLAGLRVVEMAHFVAGPAAGLLFAELGAEVIRVEQASDVGSESDWANRTGWAAYANRNKHSLAVDLKSVEGKEIFLQLAETADVVLDNFAPGTVERLGVSYDDIRSRNAGVVYLSIKGFLPGPHESRQLLDELAQMMGGLAFMTGPAGKPLRAGSSVIDICSACCGVVGVLAALIQRSQTGRGQKVTSGLFETSVFLVAQHMVSAAVSQMPSTPLPEMSQGDRMDATVYELCSTADDRQVFVGLISTGHWRRACVEFGLDDLLSETELDDAQGRHRAKPWLLPRLCAEFRRYTSRELQAKLDRAKVPYAPLARPDELLDEPALLESGQMIDTPVPGRGNVKLPKLPFCSSGYSTSVARAAPGRGEHSGAILASLGYGEESIRRLASAGVIRLGLDAEAEYRRSEPRHALVRPKAAGNHHMPIPTRSRGTDG